MLNAMSVEVKITPGFKTHIRLSATMSESSEAFQTMSLQKRQCRLLQESLKFTAATLKNVIQLSIPFNAKALFFYFQEIFSYHQSKCMTYKLIEAGINKCGCLPWYLMKNFVNTR